MKYLFEVAWRLAILVLPWQTRWFSDASLVGWPWEQGRLSVYASWIFIFICILFVIIHKKNVKSLQKNAERFWMVYLIFILSGLATQFEPSAVRAVGMWWVQVLLLIFFFSALRQQGVAWRKVAIWFCISLLPHALLGAWQFVHQEVIGSSLFGIASQLPETLGVSVIAREGIRTLRAYGGFPHPNIFGGWLAIGALVSTVLALNDPGIQEQQDSGFMTYTQQRICWAVIASCFASVLICTFSRSAILGFVVGFFVLLIVSGRNVLSRFVFSTHKESSGIAEERMKGWIFLIVFFSFFGTAVFHTNLLLTRVIGSERLEMKSLETRARAQAEFIDVYHAHSWIGTGPNAELYALSTQKEMTTVSEPLEPPHSVFLLALVNFGRIGSVLLILCVLSFYRKRARLADLILLAPLFIFSVFDHYLWSTWSGQVLGALTFFLIFGKIFHTESWHSHNEFANSHKLTPFSMNVRPLSDRVIVKPLSKEQSTASGIIIPDTVDKERPEQGEVIAVGPGRRMDNGSRAGMDLKVGDKIVFKKYSPDEIKVGDEEVLVISESDVMAVLEN